MGGKDVVCVKQLKGSSLTQSDVQARLKKLADDMFSQDRAESSTARDGRFSHVSPLPCFHLKLFSSYAERRELTAAVQEKFGPGSAAWHSFKSPVVSHKDVSQSFIQFNSLLISHE
jgi:hypothetical protein